MYCLLEDTSREFIEKEMIKIDSEVYTKDDFNTFFSLEHDIIAYKHNDRIVAFCCIALVDDIFKVCYTWCDKSKIGKMAYAKGIDVILKSYDKLGFAEGAFKFNKIKRVFK